jgi:hypothetical protein
MKTNPFVFMFQAPKPLTRLTDIDTNEVSLVDKAANKRKFAIIKRDSENAMEKSVNAEQFLAGLNTGLGKLINLTEIVKAKVEKSEDVSFPEAGNWKSEMEALMGWASSAMASHFGSDPAQPTTETNMASEVAEQTPGTATAAGDAAGGEAANANDSVRAEIDGQMVTGTTEATGDVAAGAAVVEAETIRGETAEQMVTGTTEVTGENKIDHTNSSGSVINKAQEFTAAILDMASTELSDEKLAKAMGLTEGLFFSGGFSVDAWDIEALAAVVNAICEQMSDPEDIEKSADRIVADVAKKTVAVTKRIAKADYKLTAADSKEMKVATMMLKAVADGMKGKKKKGDGKEASNAGSLGKPDTDGKKPMKKDDTFTAADIAKIVNDAVASAVTKAIEPLAKKNAELQTTVTTVTDEKNKIVKDYNAAVSATQTRNSSSETATSNDTSSSAVHINSVGIADYNAKAE